MIKIALLLCVISISACSYNPQTVKLDPHITVAQTNIGQGREVAIKVVDERPSQTVGLRRGLLFEGARITTNQDVSLVFNAAFKEALATMGFTPVPYSQYHPNALKIDIKDLSYFTSTGYWTSGIHTNISAKVTLGAASNPFESFYSHGDEKRHLLIPWAGENTQIINGTVSAFINELIADQALLEVLLRTPPQTS